MDSEQNANSYGGQNSVELLELVGFSTGSTRPCVGIESGSGMCSTYETAQDPNVKTNFPSRNFPNKQKSTLASQK